MPITSSDNYFEDFRVGAIYDHPRARTIDNADNLWITHLTLNTAQVHFNLDYRQQMMGGIFAERLVMGAVTLALVVGLTSEDMSENAFMDLGMDEIKLSTPVYRDDTLYASSEVLEVRDSEERPDAGIVAYRFTGRNSDGAVVVQGKRTLLVKRRSHWAVADGHGKELADERNA
ncbi:MaoC family dehydratase [Nocardia sp. CA-120079]|uniref:MaoC family dehydratase n=1 Tax=Nocardia sp. CA-120079 TaxID=3239974 RepID=UPI003D956C1D